MRARAAARRRRDLVLFAILVAAGVALATAGVKAPERLRPAARQGLAVTAPLARVGSRAAEWVTDATTGLAAWRRAHGELEAARVEMRDLRLALADRAELAAENARLRELLEARQALPLRTIAARIVRRSRHPDCVLVIDRGGADDVRPGASVVAAEGVVGKVLAVTAKAAKVQCLVDPDAGIAVLVGDGRQQVDAVVRAAGDGLCRLDHADQPLAVAAGDRVVTSGLDQVHPKGFLVGTVAEVRDVLGLRQEVLVRPAVDFSRLEEVLVVVGPTTDAPQPAAAVRP